MSHLVVVDAYNAAWRMFGDMDGDLDKARRRLVERIRQATPGRLVPGGVGRVHLVFDTLPGAYRAGLRGREGKVSWHYATGSADDAILEHLRRHEGRKGGPHVVLVTNDRELAGRARQLGARTVGVDAFFGPGTPPVTSRPISYAGPPFTPSDFDLPEGQIDLADPEADPD